MEIIIFFIIIAVAGIIYYQLVQIDNRRKEQLLKDFVNMIVPCKIEKHDGFFYIYNGLDSKFIAQAKTANELRDILVPDKMYMNWECTKTVFDAIKDWEEDCTPLKSG